MGGGIHFVVMGGFFTVLNHDFGNDLVVFGNGIISLIMVGGITLLVKDDDIIIL